MSVVGDIIGGITGQTGAEAAERAGGLQAGAITEASRIQQASQREAMEFLAEQLGITREQFAPFIQAGREAIPGVQRAATVGGLEQTIADIIGGETFGGLLEERRRGITGQLAAGGLTRSGAAIEEGARIPTDLALQLENLLTGRQQQLVGTGLTAAAQEAAPTANLTQSIVQAITGGAQAAAGGITGAAQATAAGILGGAQARTAGIQNLLNLGGSLGAAAIRASDPRLKQNITKIGEIGPFDLVEWEWIPELEGSCFNAMPTIGYLSTQVKEIFPDRVMEFGGYDVIDYPGVNEDLVAWQR